MKRYPFLFALLSFSVMVFAQTDKPGLSPLTRKYVQDIRNASAEHPYLFKKTEKGRVAGALIKVKDAVKAQAGLNALGATVGTKAGNIWTVRIPEGQIEAFTSLPGIS